MKVSITEIRELMKTALISKGLNEQDIPFLVEMYLGGELRGHTSHGLASFSGFINQNFSGLEEPVVIKHTNSVFIIDAKSNPGAIVGKRAADEAILLAKKETIGVALVKNMDSWLRPGAVAQYIAEQGYFTIVVNDGGGTSTAPPGGYDPVLATNPIAYGIPTSRSPLIVDMATSKHAWGQVRLANKYGTDLPEGSFYNSQGELTRDPEEAHSVLPFGGHKGFALALMIEVLCGSLVGMDSMMLETNKSGSTFGVPLQDRGGFILVIDPSQTTSLDVFKDKNSELLEKIKQTSTLEDESIRIPGEEASRLEQARLDADEINIPEELWQELRSLI